VLEHGIQALKADLNGNRTNWYGLLSAAAAALVIVGSIFGLAEWRVSNAQAPLVEAAREARKAIQHSTDMLVEIRIKQGVMEAENNRVKVEQEARIRARVDAEQRRATEHAPAPPAQNSR
jgi:hypothetical protein